MRKLTKKINVEEFVNEYNQASDKEKFLDKNVFNHKYVGHIEKMLKCQNIVESTMYKKLKDTKIFVQNTPLQYVLLMLTLISEYTEIDNLFEKGRIIENFDLLESNHLVLDIIYRIPDREFKLWDELLEQMIFDEKENNRSLGSYLDELKLSIPTFMNMEK